MQRIDDANAVVALPAAAAPGTPGYFSEGDPTLGQAATRVTEDWANGIQEELIAFLAYMGITPSKTVLNQVLTAVLMLIQAGKAEYAADVGVANAYVINPSQAIAAYVEGQKFRFKAANASTGVGATLNVSGLGAIVLTRRDGSHLHAGDIPVGAMCDVECVGGTSFQLMNADVAALPLDGSAAMQGFLTLNADPTSAAHAATKRYVDNLAAGLKIMPASKAASVGANVTLSGLQTIDGVSLGAGDLFLAKDQTSAAQNGLYTVASSAWSRVTQMSTWTEVLGAVVFVQQGTVNAQSSWVSTAASGGTLGTDPIPFTAFLPTGHYQPLDALLSALANLDPIASGNILYTTGANVFAAAAITAFGRSLIAAASASAARSALGLGAAAVMGVGNVGAVVPRVDGGGAAINWGVDLTLPTVAPTSIYSVGYRGRPGNRVDSNLGLTANQAGTTLKHGDLSSPVTYTLLADSDGGYFQGQVMYVRNGPGSSSAVIYIAPASGVTLRWGGSTGTRTIAPNGYATLVKDADTANEWMITGDGIS